MTWNGAPSAPCRRPFPGHDHYAAAIRREYAWLPEARYRTGRIAVLQQFLQRRFIYHTGPMRQEREEQARKNLVSEIARLTTGATQK
jgi:predicted metal-dependent HD superfamily phosphohydrolase